MPKRHKGAEGGAVGASLPRLDGPDKVHGSARYTDDYRLPGMLYAAVLSGAHAHAQILSIDRGRAAAMPGVRGVFTGEDFPFRVGLYLGDKPPLATGRVRYFGEPVAAVVADTEALAMEALTGIQVEYRPLPVLQSPRAALSPGAPVIHPEMASYVHIPDVLPEPGGNVANRTVVRKGDPARALAGADVVVEQEFSFPPGDHAAMEPRIAVAEIKAGGRIIIRSSTQSPFNVRAIMSRCLGIDPGRITVIAPHVGGGFGGKAGIQLEPLAYLLSKSVGGRPVRLANSRELDMVSSPGAPGLEARVKLGARRDGRIVAARIEFFFDSGGYADYAVNVSRAAAFAAPGPYAIANVSTDSLCVYTNHPFFTAYRGFGHIEMSFAVERAIEILAERLKMDPARVRALNAARRGDTTATGARLDENTGNLRECLKRVTAALDWEGGLRRQVDEHTVRAKGVSCFWKAPAIPTFTDAAAVVSFNEDGSVNLASGAVEIGQGTHTGLRQLVAEKLKMDPSLVHVVEEVMTDRAPHDWTTAASRTLFMVGRAALAALEDAIAQIRRTASAPLRCPEEDLEVAGGRVYLRDDPEQGLGLEKVVLGYVYPNGNTVGGPVIGRGRYVARQLSGLDPETGQGRPGLEWTMGAEAAEVEVDLRDGSFRVLKAACCIDAGRVINPQLARTQVVGAMAMGIGWVTREGFHFDRRGGVLNGALRDFKLLRYGEHPQYFVEFVETPQGDGPFGARGIGEQGILGMPGAVSAAVSRAIGRQLTRKPITPEYVWREIRAAAGEGLEEAAEHGGAP